MAAVTPSPFGLFISGSPVQVHAEALSPTQYAYHFASTLLHTSRPVELVAFLLPQASLPPDSLAGIYLQASVNGPYALLGALSAEMSSIVFTLPCSRAEQGQTELTTGVVTVGVSIEPAAGLLAQVDRQSLKTGISSYPSTAQANDTASTKFLAQQIIKNAFNFLAGFASTTETIPLKSFQDWWVKFERRIENDPGFLQRQQE